MPLSWNEIRHRAIAFSKEWRGESREAAERQTFWNEFFNVFGIRRRTVASFEEPVRKLSGDWGFIDLFWPGKLIVEHKSAGEDLGKARSQAMLYIRGLQDSGREAEVPRWLIVSDFARLALHDLEPERETGAPLLERLPASITFPLAELHRHIRHFAFIAGYTQHRLDPEDPANLQATELMCRLHDALEAGGYIGHELKRFLVRVLFCLFAEDNGIFPSRAFELFLLDRTAADGSDLGVRLEQLFHVLNTDVSQRQRHLDEDLQQFPYVNGDLFAERLEFADFDADMRNCLLACCRFRWETISPAVFGSLFQAVMDSKERRQIGAHYTAEKNILKLIRSLFLDDLRAEFESIKADRSTRRTARLQEFHEKLAKLRFLDPACGCGNFLVLTYRELRKLELEVLLELHGRQHEMSLDEVTQLSRLNVHQFYGIEIEEFPARIAEVALWLTDHQANVALSEAFGQFYDRLPLRASPHIHVGNALRMGWKQVLPPEQCSYILGNPPFVGKHYQDGDQRADMLQVLRDCKNTGDMDYVVCWFYKAAEYIQGTQVRAAFVATNSITQGEQVPVVWGLLFGRFHVKIQFAHRPFAWESEARGKAHVHVVIIGFGAFNAASKRIYEYDSGPDHPVVSEAANISPYLNPGPDSFVTKRTKPLADVPDMRCGNKPSDGGNFLLTNAEKKALLAVEPAAAKFVRRFTGSEEFINGSIRWCLWLKDANPAELRGLPEIMKRVQAVREFRAKSTAAPTRNAAKTPTLFFYISQPATKYILVPEVSSERRNYVPIGFMSPEVISANTNFIVPSDSLYLFGLLTSAMHMTWMRQVGGRLESRYRYSGSMVYNTFPWPQDVRSKLRTLVEAAAQAVLDARAKYPTSTLADLYDPLTMPGPLLKAHRELDRAVDRCYRPEPFASDRQRVEYLFALYEKLTAPLVAAAKPARGRRKVQMPA
ncbi:MAG TPA: DNA methyltransferase [Candidatus Acidoferrum sp.]|nr:DNA methyltransferase [Candidatus Acidoferrum sp.]